MVQYKMKLYDTYSQLKKTYSVDHHKKVETFCYMDFIFKK